MMKCKQASQLISRDLDEKLSKRERFALKFHLFLCQSCSRFSQQLKSLNVAIRKVKSNIEEDQHIQLSPETKKRIVKSFNHEN